MNRIRYVEPSIQADLDDRKMIFLGGPRQVGKTTLALGLLGGDETHAAYFNWDDVRKHSQLLRGELPPHEPLIVLDEIHKYARWRNLVKGFYDSHKSRKQFVVTGSARLDYYRKGGDSLQGRYHHYRLHPFSAGELGATQEVVHQLLKFGGFPEPYSRANTRHHQRWQKERLERVLYGDLRDLENVREVSLLELLLESLPERVGSPLSVKNLAEDLQVSFASVERWIQIFERLYTVFRIAPYGAPKIRAVKKEQKLYFWDWSSVKSQGARVENMIACQLLKYCHLLEDVEGYKMELRFVRDTDKREIDFVVLQEKRPLFAVECKTGQDSVSPHLHYFRQRTSIQRMYQVHLGTKDYGDAETSVRVLPLPTWCREMGMP